MGKSIVAGRKPKSRAAAHKSPETPISSAQRMRSILEMYDQRAFAIPSNALVCDKTPDEGLKACRELATWLFRTSFLAGGHSNGEQHVYLTLVHALQSLEEQLKPLFEALRDLAKETLS